MRSWTSKDILRRLSEDGWVVKHQVGSHVQLVHPIKAGKVTVPHPNKDLAPGTVRSIARQAGIALEVPP
ncbi:MAG: addiction module toxin, HicA family [Spirochaetae bacterium HGW-Spirochaetae-7]|jgi:predicted RNA binding protein YcfA (HicA-like mRNA interferase family)|nr:MAG: addiction module toxin, HicA family [Spirochaetae bacterium HGW-Spirochaetae-7]